MSEPLFHVVRIRDIDHLQVKIYFTRYPVNHADACTILSKISPQPRFPYIRTILEPAQ